MLGSRKRRLEDDFATARNSPHNLQWKRCMEGFSDFDDKCNNGDTGKGKRIRQQNPSCHSFLESSFDHVTDFGSDASGHNEIADAELISWSSSDGDSDAGENFSKKLPVPDKKNRNIGKDVSKESTKPSFRVKQKFPKAKRFEIQSLSQSFDCLGELESDKEIDTIYSSSDEEIVHIPGDSKPCTHLADLPKQASPMKKTKLNCYLAELDSPAIGSVQSGLSSNSDSPGTSGMKASEWVKSIDWKTPVKAGSQDDGEMGMEPDSAKKKRIKYKKDGLASQLSKLMTRERTAVRIWEHQTADETDTSKAFLVRVLSFEVLYSLQLAQCEMARIQQEGEEENSPVVEGGEWTKQVILFSKPMMERLQIEAGTLVKIYPPWQQLHLTSLGKTVLLCTNYCRVVSHAALITNKENMRTDVFATWSCPCTNDPAISREDCAVKQMPFHPSTYLTDSQQSGASNTDSPDIKLKVLQTVSGSQYHMVPPCDSLLEAIQKTSSSRALSFRGVVQRVFSPSTARCAILLEDSHGTMAVVQMGNNSVEDSMLHSEGKTCTISGVRVVTRSNKERNLALFSVMEGAWSGHMAALSSQESQEDEPVPSTSAHIPCPGFCYILAPAENARFTVSVSSEFSSSYRQPRLSPLAEVKKMVSEKRVSFLARVIYTKLPQNTDKPDVSLPIWYATDESLLSSYVVITGNADCHVPRLSGTIALFTDIHIINGKFKADGYSRIRNDLPLHIDDDSVTERHQQLGRLQVSLPLITSTVHVGSLVSVQGVITSIDEESAYSWEACDRCGSDRLVEDSTSISTCASCQRRVTSPLTKMKMEVYLQCAQLSRGKRVKVDLLQSTVEKLLPSETADEEGYDIDRVLQKEVGPIFSVVRSINKNAEDTEIYLQEIT